MSAKSCAPGVYRVSVGGAGAFLLERDDVTVMDTGPPGKVDVLLDALQPIAFTASDVKRILITHYHQDHIGNLLAIAQQTGARVYAPAGDAGLIRKGGRAPRDFEVACFGHGGPIKSGASKKWKAAAKKYG